MKLLCTHSYYARHYKELLEFVKNPEDIILMSDKTAFKPPSFEYMVIDNDAGCQKLRMALLQKPGHHL